MLKWKQLKPQTASSSQQQSLQCPSSLHPAHWHTLSPTSSTPYARPAFPCCCGTIYATSLSLGHAPRNETSSWAAAVALSYPLFRSRSLTLPLSLSLSFSLSLLPLLFGNCMQDLLRFKSFYVCRCQLLPHSMRGQVREKRQDSERGSKTEIYEKSERGEEGEYNYVCIFYQCQLFAKVFN